MNSLYEEYFLVHSVEEAIDILSAKHGSARILSGGSDLLLEIRQGSRPPVKTLVDVTEVEEMRTLEVRDGRLFLGAATTLSRIKNSSLIKHHAQALWDAASLMANPQVCNVATIGGNVAHALPAADGTISLLALDTQAEVANKQGRHMLPLQALFKGPGESTLDPCLDLLIGFYLPLRQDRQASAFTRRVNPQGIALAMLNMALWLERTEDRIIDARIAIGPAGPTPTRMTAAEKILVGQSPSAELEAETANTLLSEAHFRTSPHRATAEYRYYLASILLHEVITAAWQRAG